MTGTGGASGADGRGDGVQNGEVRTEPGPYGMLGRVELRFAQMCVALIAVLVLVSALARTVGQPVAWAVDLATFFLAWGVFVGADVAWRHNRMVSIDVLVERLSPRVRSWLQLVNHLLIALFLLAFVVLGTRLAYTTADRSFDGLPWLSYTWVTLAVPTGCLLMLYTTAHRIRHTMDVLRRSVT
ncbi:TRAP transporter small permease [Actinobacteria bacterium YIM 96077]|uniref:TRAP transporter small permease n=1 Tax=Phytoactinopolyspora halophila TaxID=1981511 RepID=A0A329QP94_9ACTN|nr:TRAP transporter small permease [Phytoactinopolyspora halophila]AYY15050.1 TRAP transporter small permease [Actinobacteria bacterium YIM 96077]RAW14184.1 TRAP transporter small permease [Phytoactinopolyspora halophila]